MDQGDCRDQQEVQVVVMDLLALVDQLDLKAPRESLDCQACLECVVRLVSQAHVVAQVYQDPQDNRDGKDPKETREMQDCKVTPDWMVCQDNQVCLALRESVASRENLGCLFLVTQVFLETQAWMVLLEPRETLVHVVCLACLATPLSVALDCLEGREKLDLLVILVWMGFRACLAVMDSRETEEAAAALV